MALSKRLLALYQMVEKGSIVADIGCDHAQLSIALVQNGICEHAYACDLREQPLKRAKEAILQAGLEKQITPCLRNGLDQLEKDVDTVIIAGMGYDTITAILSAHPQELHGNRRFIIQSNKHVDKLRQWISDHHYTIIKEDIVAEDHFYEIVCFTCQAHQPYQEDEILFGVSLYNHPLFPCYWNYRYDKLCDIMERLPENHEKQEKYTALLQRIKHRLQLSEDE